MIYFNRVDIKLSEKFIQSAFVLFILTKINVLIIIKDFDISLVFFLPVNFENHVRRPFNKCVTVFDWNPQFESLLHARKINEAGVQKIIKQILSVALNKKHFGLIQNSLELYKPLLSLFLLMQFYIDVLFFVLLWWFLLTI